MRQIEQLFIVGESIAQEQVVTGASYADEFAPEGMIGGKQCS